MSRRFAAVLSLLILLLVALPPCVANAQECSDLKAQADSFVYFDANSGEGQMEPVLHPGRGSRDPLPECRFEKRGCHFNGWNTRPDGSGKSIPESWSFGSVDPGVTLFAQWRADTPFNSDYEEPKIIVPKTIGWDQRFTVTVVGGVLKEELSPDDIGKTSCIPLGVYVDPKFYETHNVYDEYEGVSYDEREEVDPHTRPFDYWSSSNYTLLKGAGDGGPSQAKQVASLAPIGEIGTHLIYVVYERYYVGCLSDGTPVWCDNAAYRSYRYGCAYASIESYGSIIYHAKGGKASFTKKYVSSDSKLGSFPRLSNREGLRLAYWYAEMYYSDNDEPALVRVSERDYFDSLCAYGPYDFEKLDGAKPTEAHVYAKWSKAMKVRFDGNGGKVKGAKRKTVWPEIKYGKLPNAKRKGYKFLGWYTKPTGGKHVTASSRVKKVNVLYAHWSDPYKVSFVGNGGKVKGKKSKTAWKSFKYGKLPKAKRGRYKFLGWYTKASGGKKVSAATKANGAKRLFAHWLGPKGRGKTITLSEYNRIKRGMSYSMVTYLVGGKDVDGHRFRDCEWKGNNGSSSYAIVTFNNSGKVKAKYQARLR